MRWLVAALAVAGCTGQIQGTRDVGDVRDPMATPSTGPMEEPRASGDEPAIGEHHGAIGLRRLTRFEYANTVEDLLGVTGIEQEIPSDETFAFLPNNQNVARVGQADVEAYERLAGKVANASKVTMPSGCSTVTTECVRRWLPDFLVTAFRRPVEAAELQRHDALVTRLVADGATPSEALRALIAAVLMSPSFLYRSELGGSGRELSAWEVAGRLSYFLTGSMPDSELLARARDGSLTRADERQRQARRLLGGARAQRALTSWLYEWYGLSGAQLARKGKEVLAGLASLPTVQTAIEEETRRFVVSTLLSVGGSFQRLYTATSAELNDAVAAIYGHKGVGKEFQKVELDRRTRRGLFTQPLVFVAHAKESGYSVVQMGRFVRERLLCQEVPPPPEGADTTLDDSPETASLTFRQKFTEHATFTACRGCHQILDPPGFAYLAYDPIGRHRPVDPNGVPFDTAGQLLGVGITPKPFADAVTMLDEIAASREAKSCFVQKLTEYTFGRTLARADLPLHRKLLAEVEAAVPFANLIAAIVGSPEFLAPGPAEAP